MEESRNTVDNIENTRTAINQGPSAGEPERQQYFMKRARRQLAEPSARLGRPLACYINTFGCQINARDSEKLLGILETIDYKAVGSEKAGFVPYNTYTVRESANLRVCDRLGQLGACKKKHPDMMIALCGCIMQEEEVVAKIKKSYRYVDLIFETHNIFRLAELVSQYLEGRTPDGQKQGKTKMMADVWKDTDRIVEGLPVERRFPFKSGVNIMFGCNNFCSYCVVLYVRGRERDRRPEEITRKVQKLAADGAMEVMLLGQNANSYGKSLDNPMTFAQLLGEVGKINGTGRIHFMTSHPKDLSDELMKVVTGSKEICRHLHLPLQSSGSRILKVVSRCYIGERYLDLAERVKKAAPGIPLTADIVVGFPGETDEDFEETMDVVRKVRFDSAFTFIYSKRTGTPMAAMGGQVPEEIVKERFDRLLKEVQDTSAEVYGRNVRTIQEILVEEMNVHTPGLMTGRLSNNAMVHLPGDPSMIGQLVPVYLRENRGFYYMGHMADRENG